MIIIENDAIIWTREISKGRWTVGFSTIPELTILLQKEVDLYGDLINSVYIRSAIPYKQIILSISRKGSEEKGGILQIKIYE